MQQQRERAKADSKARKSGVHGHDGLPRHPPGGRHHDVHRLRRGRHRVGGHRHRQGRRDRSGGPRRRPRRDRAQPHARSTPSPAASWATTAAWSAATGRWSTSTTSRRRSPACSCIAARSSTASSSAAPRSPARSTAARRRAISRAHTATHMIHRAFRERLGDTATQMGSENSPGSPAVRLPVPGPGVT